MVVDLLWPPFIGNDDDLIDFIVPQGLQSARRRLSMLTIVV